MDAIMVRKKRLAVLRDFERGGSCGELNPRCWHTAPRQKTTQLRCTFYKLSGGDLKFRVVGFSLEAISPLQYLS